jgi:two-component system response regulator AtoC
MSLPSEILPQLKQCLGGFICSVYAFKTPPIFKQLQYSDMGALMMMPVDLSPASHSTERLVGTSPVITTLRAQIRHLVAFDAVGCPSVPTVLLQGETGTGKGLVARVMHDSGPRAAGPFLDVNCAAIPDTMLEAELFGFEPGAFTNAKRAKPGLFEAASGGTLFLDEIDTLTLPLQGKLLTAIETKRVRRLGAVAERTVDVKLIVATNVVLPECVAARRFRADLYHRLAVVILTLPPLRARVEDILVLAEAFLRQYTAVYSVPPKRLLPDAQTWLQHYTWPGNIRELSHVMERVTLLHVGEAIDAETLTQLCAPLDAPAAPQVAAPLLATSALETALPAEAEQIRQALIQTGGNVVQAARVLGGSRGVLRYRMQRYGLGPGARVEVSFPAPSRLADNAAGARQATPQPEPASVQRHDAELPGPRGSPTAPCWEHKPVAVLALKLSWPEDSGLTPLSYEPWTVYFR